MVALSLQYKWNEQYFEHFPVIAFGSSGQEDNEERLSKTIK